ncbi:hypothetical protein [Deinococcus soli (ex Cha et al. 2016)]|uniref:hypothetical protein n=1 Tax=Deinococcus soli (ex Cha et al. 2016) TaxID=1309411 RepID=UPI00166E6358|nr:hypothetical protein [Deinococcus soli (ex Cha et al. 2016)]GGB71402.1 hypothetical protein GCM10008019_29490 [Deinococcus soli (ex Cha et al. 2016)]
MSRRQQRQEARRHISRRQAERTKREALERTDDPVLRGLITAAYERLVRGYIHKGDRTPHYTYQLGLTPPQFQLQDEVRDLPPIIRRPRRQAA